MQIRKTYKGNNDFKIHLRTCITTSTVQVKSMIFLLTFFNTSSVRSVLRYLLHILSKNTLML